MNKRILSLFLCFVLFIMMAAPGVVSAEENAPAMDSVIYGNGQIKVENRIESAWQGGFQGSLTITNVSAMPIENWALSMEFPYEINNIWNAEVKSHTDDRYVIQNAGWNQLIQVNESVSFGYLCNSEKTEITLPLEYTLLGRQTAVLDESVEISFEVTNQWAEGYTANISIHNKGEQPIQGWKLKFFSEDSIANIWNAYVQKQENNSYVLGNANYNAIINGGSNVVVGYQAASVSDNSISYPSEFELTQISQEEPDKPKDADNPEEPSPDGDKSIAERIYAGLEPEYQGWDNEFSVTQNLSLPDSEDAEIVWVSSDGTVVSNDGVVTRPHGSSKSVILTATIRKGETELVKSFPMKVIKNDYADYDKEAIEDMDSYESLYEYNDEIEVYLNEKDERLEYILGNFSDFIVESPQEALLALYGLRTLLNCKDPQSEFEWVFTNEDFYSRAFCFRQMYKGVPVYGSMTNIVTDLEGNIVTLHTDYKPVAVDTVPSVTLESAGEAAGTDKIYEGKLCIYRDGVKDRLAWQMNALKDGQEWIFVVDAHSGEVIFQTESAEYEEETTGSGLDEWGELTTFPVLTRTEEEQTVYVMYDSTRNIKMYDATLAENAEQRFVQEITSETNEFSDACAVSAYQNVMYAYDYYLNTFKRRGFGNDSAQIKVAVHESFIPKKGKTQKNNAAHVNGNIVFGKVTEDRFIHSYAAAKDVVVHEYTHGVAGKVTALSGGSGVAKTINEAYADVMGALATGEWQQAARVLSTGCNRDIASPENSKEPYPTAIGDRYYSEGNDPHYNSTIISHACYYMCSHGISDKKKLAQLWYTSLLMGYGNEPSYYNVRINVLAAARLLPFGFRTDEIKVIEDAFDNAGIYEVAAIKGIATIGESRLSGRVVVADNDRNAANNGALSGVTVTVEKLDGTEVESGTTNSYGDYSFSNIPVGKYRLVFTKEEYKRELLYFTITKTKPANCFPVVEMLPRKMAVRKGTATGVIKSSATGFGIEGLTLYVRKGLSNKSGETICSTVTERGGAYSIGNLYGGNYCVQIVDERDVEDRERYLTTYFNIKVVGDEIIDRQNASVTGKLDMNEIRIVLEWGGMPRILDPYLSGWIPKDGGHEYLQIGNQTKNYMLGNQLIAKISDNLGSGLRTVTVYTTPKGKYAFYVHNYSHETSFQTSGACVQVYIGQTNIADYTFYAPNVGIAEYWSVFSYDAKKREMTIVNRYSAKPVTCIL